MASFRTITIFLLVCWAGVSDLRADVFLLETGGRADGELVNSDESPRRQFVIRTPAGIQITVAASQVSTVVRETVDEARYEKIVAKIEDTAEVHWKMADWCRENQLHRQREFHLERVVVLEPDHVNARRALGFTQRNGQWVRPGEWMKAHGYIHHKGAWRTRQDVELQRTREEHELAEKDFRVRIKKWRRWIGGRKDREARDNIQQLSDPRAALGLAEWLETEQLPQLKQMVVDALGRVGGPVATNALIRQSLENSSEVIRDQSLEELRRDGSHAAVRVMIDALRNKRNVTVNRAAVGLGRLQNPAAVLPLIRALETEHRFVAKGRSGAISPSFGNGGNGGGGGGLTVGDGGTRVFKKKYRNDKVLVALVELTGVNFNFDRERWMAWYSEKQNPRRATLRRDT